VKSTAPYGTAVLTVSRDLPKLGYKGVESCELSFEDHRAPVDALLGGVEGEGFAQMMKGLEATRQLTLYAAREADAGRRVDMEAGMAKLFASETAMQIALNAVRVHGG
jgi:alkylation response protein AidB-like acyl-CoA dehydrogenase